MKQEEMGDGHTSLGHPQGMSNLSPLLHFLRIFVEPTLDSFKHVLMFQAIDPTLFVTSSALSSHRLDRPVRTIVVLCGVSQF